MQVDAQLLTRLQLWYAREARLLDERRFDHWLELVDPVIRYRIPTRYLTEQGKPNDFSQWSVERELGGELDLFMLDDDYEALQARIERLRSGMAWAETPPSFTRRMVGNVEPVARGPQGELEVYTALLLYKSRGPDSRTLLSAQRRDVLADTGDDFRLRKRTAILDDTVLMGENLSTIL
jgi:PAH dioxygenase small subunit